MTDTAVNPQKQQSRERFQGMSVVDTSTTNGMPSVQVGAPPATEGSGRDQAELQKVMLTRVGLRMPPTMTFEHWERTGIRLSGIVDTSAWCLGDWLIYGKEQYTNRYRHVVQTVGLDYQTLRNYAWVARHFPIGRRRQRLSFQHHAEVASMPPCDQEWWLDEAEKQGWSVKHLRASIKAARTAGSDDKIKVAVLPRIPVPDRRLTRWRQAADLSETDFNQWVVATLDRAAAETLDESIMSKVE
jgi:hypothetical protein